MQDALPIIQNNSVKALNKFCTNPGMALNFKLRISRPGKGLGPGTSW